MKKVGIIGAGRMGTGIAQKTAQEGLSVVMMTVRPQSVEKGMNMIRSGLKEAVERKIYGPEEADAILGRIHGTTRLEDVNDCDLVIETVPEDMEIKKDVFARLDQICGSKTMLATNTSSFSIAELAKATNRPERFIGLHFFYPVTKNKLLEIIPTRKTSQETISASEMYSNLTGKTKILVKESAGFVVNRSFVPLNNEAFRILEEGIANIPTIDHVAKELLGVGMGPFLVVNVTGVPVAYHVSNGLAQKLGPFYRAADILEKQVESGQDWPLEGDVEPEKMDAVRDRLLGVIFFTTTSLLNEGVTPKADIDLAAKVGLRWKKGPFEMMNDVGIDRTYTLVEDLLKPWPDEDIPGVLKAQEVEARPWDL